jgi:hypothetical protein
MSDASLAMADLATKLGSVATVRTGLTATETTSAALPVITLWSINDAPVDGNQGRGHEYTRTLVIEYKAVASSFGDGLDTALTAIRNALKTELASSISLSGYANQLRQTGARFFFPG